MLYTAFEVVSEDIVNVLYANKQLLKTSSFTSLDALGESIYQDWSELELNRIALVALDGGVDMDDQTAAAYAEIFTILVEKGVLKPN